MSINDIFNIIVLLVNCHEADDLFEQAKEDILNSNSEQYTKEIVDNFKNDIDNFNKKIIKKIFFIFLVFIFLSFIIFIIFFLLQKEFVFWNILNNLIFITFLIILFLLVNYRNSDNFKKRYYKKIDDYVFQYGIHYIKN